MNIIGHDHENNPLRSGDACVLLTGDPEFFWETGLMPGDVVTVQGACADCGSNHIVLDVKPKNYTGACMHGRSLRKVLDDRHQPADQSFADLMRDLAKPDTKRQVFSFVEGGA